MKKLASLIFTLDNGTQIESEAEEITEENEKQWAELEDKSFHHGMHNFYVTDDKGDKHILNPHHVIAIRRSTW